MFELVAEAIKHLKPFRDEIMSVLSITRMYSIYFCFLYNCHFLKLSFGSAT